MVLAPSFADAEDDVRRVPPNDGDDDVGDCNWNNHHARRHFHRGRRRRRSALKIIANNGAGGPTVASWPGLLCILLATSQLRSSSALLHVPRLAQLRVQSRPGGRLLRHPIKIPGTKKHTWLSSVTCANARSSYENSGDVVAAFQPLDHPADGRDGHEQGGTAAMGRVAPCLPHSRVEDDGETKTILQEEELRRMIREATELGRRRAAAKTERSQSRRTGVVHGESAEDVAMAEEPILRDGAILGGEEINVDLDGKHRSPSERATLHPPTAIGTKCARGPDELEEETTMAQPRNAPSGDVPCGRRSFLGASAALAASSILAALTRGGPGAGAGEEVVAESAGATSQHSVQGAGAPSRAITEGKNVTSLNSMAARGRQTTSSPTKQKEKHFEPINITKVAAENEINVTLLCPSAEVGVNNSLFSHLTTAAERGQQLATVCKTVDRESLTRVTTKVGGPLLPPWLRPRKVESIPDGELLIAGVVAGGVVECARTALLYPLLTVRNRIMAEGTTDDVSPTVVAETDDERLDLPLPYYLSEMEAGTPVGAHNEETGHRCNATLAVLRRKIRVLQSSFVYHLAQGNLYAGLLPSLLVNVPAMGVYAGIRDVSKRALSRVIWGPGRLDDVVVSLLGALVADVASLAVKTPADLLSVRLQVLGGNATVAERYRNETTATDEEDRARVGEDGGAVIPSIFDHVILGDWFRDSIRRLPATVACDLPYLLVRIAVNWAVASGGGGLGRCELQTILVACACAAATTPFDVVQTRIFLAPNEDEDTDASAMNGEEGVEERGDVRGQGQPPPPYGGIWNTMRSIVRENDGGVSNLYAGWIERTAYLGLGRAWLDPIRVIGYLGIRDAVLLSWFD